jgi:hypothetical protein
MEVHMLNQLNTLMLRPDGTPRAAFWGPIAFVALLVIGLTAA